MTTTVKGIQYSYQIDFFNQVPTRLKSQVHDLPVLSVPRPTPIDDNEQNQAAIPDAENRQTYAGTNASPVIREPASIPSSEADTTTETVQNAAAAINIPISRAPAQIVSHPGPQENRVTPLNTEPQLNLHNVPAVEPNDIPRSDSKPDEPVKAIPKFEFNRAQKAYKPDYASFLQPAAHQDLLIANQPPAEPQQRPQNITPNPQNPVEMVNSSAVPIESQPLEETSATETITPAQQPANAREDNTTQSFLMQQAQRLYEIFGDTGLISTSRQVDFYF